MQIAYSAKDVKGEIYSSVWIHFISIFMPHHQSSISLSQLYFQTVPKNGVSLVHL